MRFKYPGRWAAVLAGAVLCTAVQAQPELEEANEVKTCEDGSNDIPCTEIGSLIPYKSALDFIKQTKLDGQIRNYYFNRIYGPGSLAPNQSAYSLAGLFNLHTPSVYGVSAHVGFYTANSLGTHSTNPNSPVVDGTLAGLTSSLNTLGQAYIQYQYQDIFKFRAGNQILNNNPWVNPSDSRVIPATYQGFYGEVSPLEHVHLYGMRIFRWKSRTSANYSKDNLYYRNGFDGDPMYGGNAGLRNGVTPPEFQGTTAFGASAEGFGGDAQIWYYNFYQFAKMIHADANYTLKTGTGIDPFINTQFIREWGNSLLSNAQYNNARATLGSVNSTAFGVRTGINYDFGGELIGPGTLSLAYNRINEDKGALFDGAIISPYTVGYATDPLYTTSMIRGMVDMAAAGSAYKVNLTQHFWDRRFRLTVAYASYNLQGNQNGSADDEYVDLAYSPQGYFKGLTLRNRFEVAHGHALGGGTTAGVANRQQYFIYNRVMVTYAF